MPKQWMEKEITKKYTNGEITIVWKPTSCIHSTLCWQSTKGLPQVFNPKLKPWIMPDAADSEKIITHIKNCPSGALSFYYNKQVQDSSNTSEETKIEAAVNGPLLVYGNVLIKDSKGTEMRKSNVTALCRCGKSENKPFCDGGHVRHNFEG